MLLFVPGVCPTNNAIHYNACVVLALSPTKHVVNYNVVFVLRLSPTEDYINYEVLFVLGLSRRIKYIIMLCCPRFVPDAKCDGSSVNVIESSVVPGVAEQLLRGVWSHRLADFSSFFCGWVGLSSSACGSRGAEA